MKLASILLPLAGLGLAGYALSSHFGDTGPDAVVVSVPQRTPEAGITRTASTETQKALPTPGDRAGLTRELQKELKRVGCYQGDVSGVWTTSSRMAMKAFTDRVNATLPIDAPDYILLSLVQRHQGKACGTDCPSGQLLSDDGRCVPSAVLAKAGKVPAASEVKVTERAADQSADKAGSTADASSKGGGTSWSPTAAVPSDLRTPAIRGNSALAAKGEPTTKSTQSETREDRTRVSSSKSDAATTDEVPVTREKRSSRQRVGRSDELVPEVGVYEKPNKRKVRSAQSKPPKVVRKFLRSMQRALAGGW